VSTEDADARRASIAASWERVSSGWGRRADRLREWGLPVSIWMIDHLGLVPGQRLLELAAGPGDTGFLAAELIAPGGILVSSDASESMLGVARERAAAQGISNVEFQRLELEWIDLPTASVDAILCRWGVMLTVDPATALRECRRVLRPGGRIALAVWDVPRVNPWMTLLQRTIVEGGFAPAGPAPPPGEPGPFALAEPGALEALLGDTGFLDRVVERVALARRYASVAEWLEETADVSMMFAEVWARLSEPERAELTGSLASAATEFEAAGGGLVLPGSSLVAVAQA
jgi:SAM-dependent methyltransferase